MSPTESQSVLAVEEDDLPTVVADISEPDVTPDIVDTPTGPSFEDVAAFVANEQGPTACFAAMPFRRNDGTVAVTAYAEDTNTSEILAGRLAQQFDDEVPVEPRALAPGQCGVLSFLRDNGGNSPAVSIGLSREAVTNGGFLEGSVRRGPRTIVYLFIIDDDGQVLRGDVEQFDDGTTVDFRAEVHATGDGLNANHLLVAIISSEALEMPEKFAGKAADEFFALLNQEVATKELLGGASIDIAMTSFTVVD